MDIITSSETNTLQTDLEYCLNLVNTMEAMVQPYAKHVKKDSNNIELPGCNAQDWDAIRKHLRLFVEQDHSLYAVHEWYMRRDEWLMELSRINNIYVTKAKNASALDEKQAAQSAVLTVKTVRNQLIVLRDLLLEEVCFILMKKLTSKLRIDLDRWRDVPERVKSKGVQNLSINRGKGNVLEYYAEMIRQFVPYFPLHNKQHSHGAGRAMTNEKREVIEELNQVSFSCWNETKDYIMNNGDTLRHIVILTAPHVCCGGYLLSSALSQSATSWGVNNWGWCESFKGFLHTVLHAPAEDLKALPQLLPETEMFQPGFLKAATSISNTLELFFVVIFGQPYVREEGKTKMYCDPLRNKVAAKLLSCIHPREDDTLIVTKNKHPNIHEAASNINTVNNIIHNVFLPFRLHGGRPYQRSSANLILKCYAHRQALHRLLLHWRLMSIEGMNADVAGVIADFLLGPCRIRPPRNFFKNLKISTTTTHSSTVDEELD